MHDEHVREHDEDVRVSHKHVRVSHKDVRRHDEDVRGHDEHVRMKDEAIHKAAEMVQSRVGRVAPRAPGVRGKRVAGYSSAGVSYLKVAGLPFDPRRARSDAPYLLSGFGCMRRLANVVA